MHVRKRSGVPHTTFVSVVVRQTLRRAVTPWALCVQFHVTFYLITPRFRACRARAVVLIDSEESGGRTEGRKQSYGVH